MYDLPWRGTRSPPVGITSRRYMDDRSISSLSKCQPTYRIDEWIGDHITVVKASIMLRAGLGR